jgi:microcompartment protein CcmK/EutM
MRTIRAIVEHDKVVLLEPTGLTGRHEAVVVVEEEPSGAGDDAWAAIVRNPSARPAFDSFVAEADREIAEGETQPLDPDRP